MKAILNILLLTAFFVHAASAQAVGHSKTRVVVESDDWLLVGDLLLPDSHHTVPCVLMLNKAAGDRTVYMTLALELADRGIASLTLDLRGHGDSVNKGRFVPGEVPDSPMIWDAEADVIAAHRYLTSYAGLDGGRIGIVGASYSGEEAAEAGRMHGFAQAYAVLSPGSLSNESIAAMDSSDVAWLFVASNGERYLQEITESVRTQSQRAEVVIVPGTAHATDILAERPDMAERMAVWLEAQLR